MHSSAHLSAAPPSSVQHSPAPLPGQSIPAELNPARPSPIQPDPAQPPQPLPHLPPSPSQGPPCIFLACSPTCGRIGYLVFFSGWGGWGGPGWIGPCLGEKAKKIQGGPLVGEKAKKIQGRGQIGPGLGEKAKQIQGWGSEPAAEREQKMATIKSQLFWG